MTTFKLFKNSILICTLLALVACSGKPRPARQIAVDPDPTVLRLADAADRAASAMELLAAIENERTPVELAPLAANAPTQLRRSMSVDWVGPAEPLIKQIADRASYEFFLSGAEPTLPIVVNISARNRPVIEILRDLGLQIGDRGTLKVDANEEVIELSYAPNTSL